MGYVYLFNDVERWKNVVWCSETGRRDAVERQSGSVGLSAETAAGAASQQPDSVRCADRRQQSPAFCRPSSRFTSKIGRQRPVTELTRVLRKLHNSVKPTGALLANTTEDGCWKITLTFDRRMFCIPKFRYSVLQQTTRHW